MEIGKTTVVSLMIGLLVSVLILGFVLVPVLNGTVDSIGTEADNENAGAFFSDAPATIKCTSDGEWLVNGEEVTGHVTGYLVSDKGIVTMAIGSGSSGFYILSDGTLGTLRNIKVTESGFSYATTSDSETYIDVPCKYVYYSANSGDYALYTDSFTANDNDNVIAFNKGSSGYLCAQLNKEEVNFFAINNTPTAATIESNATITPGDRSSEWSSSAWTLTYGENSTLSGTSVIAPATYTILTTEQNDLISLMYVIPLFVIIALLVLVANRVRYE